MRPPGLATLARLYGVQSSYYGADGRAHDSPPEAVLAVLRALGAHLDGFGDVPEAVRALIHERSSEVLAPVTVAWEGRPAWVRARGLTGKVHCGLALEDGSEREWTAECAGRLRLPDGLPWGYHELSVGNHSTRLIVAPWRADSQAGAPAPHDWGVFLPLYALPGEADFSGLRRLGEWAAGLGASVVGTLPLLASFLDEPFEPSPYAPVSRLAWNEFYVHVPGVVDIPGDYVDYRGVMDQKREILKAMVRDGPELRAFLKTHPEVPEYAKFRGDAPYHEFAQWMAHRQLTETVSALRDRGIRLYLDLPLGVHRDGYDVWRYPDHFALEMNGGAPPDGFFIAGQDWGFPPIHPDRSRRDGHRYFIACLRHHLQVSSMLRIDHVMAMHRLYWIPQGFSAKEGVYVRYPAKELYAIVCLEARRHNAVIVGENLGTVPGYMNDALARHGVRTMYVLQYHAGGTPLPTDVASLNTHDMPTFAGFWEGLDLEDRLDLGLLTPQTLGEEAARRREVRRILAQPLLGAQASPPAGQVLPAALQFLASSAAPLVMVNLEDLWLERQPQNWPGTWRERPNWLRRARYSLEEMGQVSGVREALREVDRVRRGSR